MQAADSSAARSGDERDVRWHNPPANDNGTHVDPGRDGKSGNDRRAKYVVDVPPHPVPLDLVLLPGYYRTV